MTSNSPHLLSPERIKIINRIESKKCAFDLLSELLTDNQLKQYQPDKHEIFDALIFREKLGNTCIGKGIAIPRAHMDINKPIAALLVIKNGLEIETIDNNPIKVFLAIIVPEKQREKFSEIIKKLNLILVEEENIKIFTEKDSEEYLANYFESLLATQILATGNTDE